MYMKKVEFRNLVEVQVANNIVRVSDECRLHLLWLVNFGKVYPAASNRVGSMCCGRRK
jgi:hypothetical protein